MPCPGSCYVGIVSLLSYNSCEFSAFQYTSAYSLQLPLNLGTDAVSSID